MEKPIKSLNIPKKGMSRKNPLELENTEYSFAMNANLENSSEDFFSLSNEQSNLLATRFKLGFKFIGGKVDIDSNTTYVFLTNPVTGEGEFGKLEGFENNIQISQPLENTIQQPLQTYTTLLNDSCNNGFNFNIHFPIKKCAIKNEKGVKTIYFTDNRNEPRYIEINKLSQYINSQTISCGEPVGEIKCFNTDKMRIFKKHNIPDLTPTSIDQGGSLTEGTYQFLIAYSDEAGNELSQYYSLTQQITIFDENNTVQEALSEISEITNFAIKLKVEGLDKQYTHYKIAVIQNTNNAQTYFIEGLHTIDDNSVTYTTQQNKKPTTLVELIKVNAEVKKAEGLAVSNDALFLYGIESEKEWNLQPVVNFIGQFAKWQTSIASENFYESGINNGKKGYNRDEVYPLAIQFQTNTGYKTPLYPLIGRQATIRPVTDTNLSNKYDLDNVSNTNIDRKSIEANKVNCTTTDRLKRWQFYNDAKETGVCLNENILTTTVIESIEKTSTIENVVTVPGATFSVFDTQEYENLSELIEDSFEECFDYPFCEYLDITDYTNQNSVPAFDSECAAPTLVSEKLALKTITGESSTKIPSEFPLDYAKIVPLNYCQVSATSQVDGTLVKDEEFQLLHTKNTPFNNNKFVYKRDSVFSNTVCNTPEDIQNISPNTPPLSSQYFMYYGANTLSELQTTKNATSLSAEFTNKIHKGALWYRGNFITKQELILEVTKQKLPETPTDSISSETLVRLSFYSNCGAVTPIYSQIIDLSQGSQYKLRLSARNLFIKVGNGTETNLGVYNNTAFLVAIDCPIKQVTGQDDVTRFIVAPTKGCFSVVTRDIAYSRIDVTYTSIVLNKRQTYNSECSFQLPQVQNCVALPYKKGSFAYVESTETYPDNNELYNSKVLKIQPQDFTDVNERIDFEKFFTNGVTSDKYNLTEETDYRCSPIRHFKFPDNKVAPFMWDNPLSSFSASTVFPLGITIDEKVINTFLKIAVKNNLITQKQKDSLVSYEIFRGDRTTNKSIEASGYLFDMRKYQEDNKDILYSNYPYNDLGSDKLNLNKNDSLITHNNQSNYNFTFHSPETDFNKLTTPSELKVEGYIFGKSSGNFVDVHDHPKWVILGRKAKSTATTLAIIEAASELAIRVAESGENFRVAFGLSNSVNVGGIILATIAASTTALRAVGQVGRYRYEWLKTFRDLGSPKNFAYKYSSEGHYNYIKTLQEEGDIVRSINIGKKLKARNYTTVNEITGEKLEINNLDREHSTFISLGKDFPLTWDEEYRGYDNGTLNRNLSSLTYASESNSEEEGRSSNIIKNIASPYVKLKNYNPSQYGSINSISWINTGYRGDLKNPSSNCITILGGDTFITKYHLKRKMPLFVTDAMGIAPLTPFDYRKYTNIGKKARFFCDYEITGDFNRGNVVFPDFDSEYNFDSLNGNRATYVKPPSKFYLYYYGVPGILIETEINTNYRTARKEPENDFYPNVGDHVDWTQENNVSIKKPNTFFYNEQYKKPAVQLPYKTLPNNYTTFEAERQSKSPNGVRYSLQDNSETGNSDPWLVFRTNDFYEFPTSYGKLRELKATEDERILGRFENTTVYFNSIDIAVQGVFQNDSVFGNAGIFTRNKPRTFFQTDLGFGGSQSSESVSSEYGHFHVDAKRGQVMQTVTGKAPIEISGYESNLRNWFKEHLPFKMNVKGANTDNSYNGVGISMGWDSRFNRMFLTKKDYLPLNDCIEFIEGKGFFLNEFKCNQQTVLTCPEGYVLNTTTQMCEKVVVSNEICPNGYTYNSITKTCTLVEKVLPICCPTDATVVATPSSSTITSGQTTSINLTGSKAGTTFSWTVLNTGTTGAISGTGNVITQTINGEGTSIYTITPQVNGCVGQPIQVIVTVEPPLEFKLFAVNNDNFSLLNITTATGDIVNWGDEASQTTVTGFNNFTHNYVTPFTGEIKITTCSIGCITALNIGQDTLNNSTIEIKATELAKLKSLSNIIATRNKVTGTLLQLPRSLTRIDIDENTLSGSISDLPPNIVNLSITGTNTIDGYISGFDWSNNMERVEVLSNAGGLSSTEIDNLLIDLSQTTWQGVKVINLTGVHAPRTSSSSTAVATLIGLGVTVNTN